jgi:hypothetical protein
LQRGKQTDHLNRKKQIFHFLKCLSESPEIYCLKGFLIKPLFTNTEFQKGVFMNLYKTKAFSLFCFLLITSLCSSLSFQGCTTPSEKTCTSGEKKCDGNRALVCRSDGSGFDGTNCASDEACDNGECKKKQVAACTSGEKKCDGNRALVCRSDGSGFDGTNCAGDEACENGECKKNAFTKQMQFSFYLTANFGAQQVYGGTGRGICDTTSFAGSRGSCTVQIPNFFGKTLISTSETIVYEHNTLVEADAQRGRNCFQSIQIDCPTGTSGTCNVFAPINTGGEKCDHRIAVIVDLAVRYRE